MSRASFGARGHVAEVLIGGAREPDQAEARHLESCPACWAAVRRGRSFDRQLSDAVLSMAPVPVPREVLTVSLPSTRRSRTPSLTSVLVLGALIASVGLLVATFMPRGADHAAGTIPSPSADPHLVVVNGTEWRIDLVGSVIQIHRRNLAGSGGPVLIASWDLGEFVTGGSTAYLRCPRPDGGDQWAVFGHQAPVARIGDDPSATPTFTASAGPLFTYVGPPAVGQGAPDGLWLYLIDPATFNPSTPITITAPNKTRSGFGSGSLKAWPTDIKQPSGCVISG
jgi:hypothetical protein